MILSCVSRHVPMNNVCIYIYICICITLHTCASAGLQPPLPNKAAQELCVSTVVSGCCERLMTLYYSHPSVYNYSLDMQS